MTRSIVGPRWLMMTPLACATACGMGTGPAPISSSGSLGRIADSGRLGGAEIWVDTVDTGLAARAAHFAEDLVELVGVLAGVVDQAADGLARVIQLVGPGHFGEELNHLGLQLHWRRLLVAHALRS